MPDYTVGFMSKPNNIFLFLWHLCVTKNSKKPSIEKPEYIGSCRSLIIKNIVVCDFVMRTMCFLSEQELLALEESMGTVSTAVPEDDLAKCLKRNIYQGVADCREDEHDIKCSICQVSHQQPFYTFPFPFIR